MKKYFIYPFYSLSALLSALFLSWLLLYPLDFAYSTLYGLMGIEEHIHQYGPQNRYRSGFQFTEKPEHERLFSAINESVHNNGEGLADIHYYLANGHRIDTLLREPEVIHLQDVAHLINVFAWLGLSALVLWLGLGAYCLKCQVALPSLKQQVMSVGSIVLGGTLIILLIGPVKVFYAFHIWLFPEEHQWFFYYQESLMTILMKAPDLFGYIALLLAILAMALFTVMHLALTKLQARLTI